MKRIIILNFLILISILGFGQSRLKVISLEADSVKLGSRNIFYKQLANVAATLEDAKYVSKVIGNSVTVTDSVVGGNFLLLPSGTNTVDNGVVYPTNDPAWVLVRQMQDKVVHSKWFLKGDGVTNDAIPMQTMISKYQHVFFDRGFTYHIKDSTIKITLNGQTIASDGARIEQEFADSNKIIFLVKQASHVTFDGLTIIGSTGRNGVGNYANGTSAIQFDPASDYGVVNNCLIIKQDGVNMRHSNFMTVSNNHIYFTEHAVMAWADSAQACHDISYLHNYCTIDTSGGLASTNNQVRGLKSQNAYNVICDGNTVFGASLSIEFFYYNPAKATNYVVTNNIVDTYISLVSGTAICSNNIVDYNLRPANAAAPWVDAGHVGILGIELTGLYNAICIGNYVKDQPGIGIFNIVPASASSQLINRLKGGIIADNWVIHCGDSTQPANFPASIGIGNGDNIDIHDNMVVNSINSGIGVTGQANRYTTNVKIHDNQVVGGKGYGIWTFYTKNIGITNNYVYGQSNHGILIGNGAGTTNAVVEHNRLYNNGGYGINLNGANVNLNVNYNQLKGNALGAMKYYSSGLLAKMTGNDGLSVLNIPPQEGTYEVGDFVPTGSNSSVLGRRCKVAGTAGTIFHVKANTVKDTNLIVVNDSNSIAEDDYITIAGSPSAKYKIMRVDGFNVTLYTNMDTTLTDADVNFYAPTFGLSYVAEIPTFQDTLDPNNNKNAPLGSQYVYYDANHVAHTYIKKATTIGPNNLGWDEIDQRKYVHGMLPSSALFLENLFKYSNTFDNSFWTKTNVIITKDTNAYSPDSVRGVYKAMQDTGFNAKTIETFIGFTKPAISQDYTVSIFVKPINGQNIISLYFGQLFSSRVKVIIDLQNNVIGAYDTSAGYVYKYTTITKLNKGWYQVALTATIPDYVTNLGFAIYFNNYLNEPAGANNSVPDTSKGLYIAKSQLSQTSYVLPYVETQGTIIQRKPINWNILTNQNIVSRDTLNKVRDSIVGLNVLRDTLYGGHWDAVEGLDLYLYSHSFGNVQPVPNCSPNRTYGQLLTNRLKLGSYSKRSNNGYWAQDVAAVMMNGTVKYNPGTTGVVIIDCAQNDFRKGGGSSNIAANYAAGFKHSLRSMLWYLRCSSIVQQTDPSFTFYGTWTDLKQTVFMDDSLKLSGIVNDSAIITASGTDFVLFTRATQPAGGSANVFVDGTLYTTITNPGSQAVVSTSPLGATSAPMAIPITGLSAGSHTIKVVITVAGSVFIDALGIVGTTPPEVLVHHQLYLSDIAYASFANSFSNATVNTMNGLIDAVVAEFPNDGTIKIVDPNSNGWDRNTMLGGFQVQHPNDKGMLKIAETDIKVLMDIPYRQGMNVIQ